MFFGSEIIKNKPKFVGEAALKWLERYEANPVDGLNELLLTMFEVRHFLRGSGSDTCDRAILVVVGISACELFEDLEVLNVEPFY